MASNGFRLLVTCASIDTFEKPAIYENACNLVPQYRKQKAERIKIMKDRHRCIAGGILLNASLQEFVKHQSFGEVTPLIKKVDLAEATLKYDSTFDYPIIVGNHGKPEFIDADLHFNISHSGDYVVCAISNRKVGIDIESGKDNMLKVANRYFAENELKLLASLTDPLAVLNQCRRMWTIKEACGKAEGVGVPKFLSFDTTDAEKQFSLTEFDLTDYHISVAVMK